MKGKPQDGLGKQTIQTTLTIDNSHTIFMIILPIIYNNTALSILNDFNCLETGTEFVQILTL
jgi:hypothetical protein